MAARAPSQRLRGGWAVRTALAAAAVATAVAASHTRAQPGAAGEPAATPEAPPTAPPVPDAPSVAALRDRLDRLATDRVPAGTRTGIAYQLETAARIADRYPRQSAEWRARADRFLATAEAGRDPYAEARGALVPRGYRSALVTPLQGYALYLPPDYDPSRTWPLLVMLHGGSSNGNLFLGVVLGQNLKWTEYTQHLWDTYEPRWSPGWIVVAPDGFGQPMWRWMGERDVLDVIDDVLRDYAVDPDRVVLGGLSNGGVGAYAIGARHASRFAAVLAIAGAPSWVQYAGGLPRLEAERRALLPWSMMHLAENVVNTDFRWYHGDADTGPMRPEYVRELEALLARRGLPATGTWYEAGHDILYRAHRHGAIYDELAPLRRDRSPAEVRVVTGDYRAARQHWVEVTRLEAFPALGTVRARVEGTTVRVETERVRALALDLRDAPLPRGAVAVEVDGSTVYEGPREALGHRLHLSRGQDGAWATGFPPAVEGLEKRPGLSGPITDAYVEPLVHVYGTREPEATEALRAAAERGARGWPLWLWNFAQPVLPDTAVDEATMRDHSLVLYGTAGSNAVLERVAHALPIRLEPGAVVVGETRYVGADVGTRFVFPSPLAPDRYLVVQGGASAAAVAAGHALPDFLPDWVVYDERTTRSRARLTSGGNRPLALGWFDDRWRLRPEDAVPQPDR